MRQFHNNFVQYGSYTKSGDGMLDIQALGIIVTVVTHLCFTVTFVSQLSQANNLCTFEHVVYTSIEH